MADPAICVISDQILCIDPHDSGSSELVNKFGKGATIGVGRSLWWCASFAIYLDVAGEHKLATVHEPCTNERDSVHLG